MSYTGVKIGRIYEDLVIDLVDTLEEWGLILTDELSISEAKLKETLIDVPGTDGALNLSYALTGGVPVFEMRDISFTLFASGLGKDGNVLTHDTPPDEETVNLIRTDLQTRYHGREVGLILPDDSTHYFKGILSVGAKSKYNSGIIPISVKAFPYRIKRFTTYSYNTLQSTDTEKTITLTNEAKRVVPKVVVFTGDTPETIQAASCQIYYGDEWHTVSDAVNGIRLPWLYLEAGDNTVRIKHVTGDSSKIHVNFIYQEGRL